MAWPSKSSSVVSCRHSTTGSCLTRASLCAMCGARMSCQPRARLASRDWSKNRYTAWVSAQSAHAPGMLAVGLSAKRLASFDEPPVQAPISQCRAAKFFLRPRAHRCPFPERTAAEQGVYQFCARGRKTSRQRLSLPLQICRPGCVESYGLTELRHILLAVLRLMQNVWIWTARRWLA